MECAYHFRVEMGLLCLWIRRAHSTMKTKETLVFQNAAENIWKLKFFKRIGMKRKVVHNGKRAYVECLKRSTTVFASNVIYIEHRLNSFLCKRFSVSILI